jgi:hypothetical protein
VYKTIDRFAYHLSYNCDRETICFEAQQNGCDLEVSKGRVSICMWETNPYGSLFALKYSDSYYAVEKESWYI